MAKDLKFEAVEIDAQGAIFLRFQKVNSDGDRFGNHYIGFPPGCDIDVFMVSVNASLAESGLNAPIVADVDRVKVIAPTIWTPAIVSAYKISIGETP